MPISHHKLVAESFYSDLLSSQYCAHEVAMATEVEAALWVVFTTVAGDRLALSPIVPAGAIYKIVPDGVTDQCGATECCVGVRGNIDGVGVEGREIDISDLVYLVDYMFTGGPPPPACTS